MQRCFGHCDIPLTPHSSTSVASIFERISSVTSCHCHDNLSSSFLICPWMMSLKPLKSHAPFSNSQSENTSRTFSKQGRFSTVKPFD
ncbi:hypothetical protein AOLI_G00048210 [Acnodon oligacanthus]